MISCKMFSFNPLSIVVKHTNLNMLHYGQLCNSFKLRCVAFGLHNNHLKRCYGSNFSNILTHSEKKSVPVPIDVMYDVVYDVEKYKEFVPWCTKSFVISRSKNAAKAKLAIGFGPIQEHYNSTLIFNKPKYIKSICSDGVLFNMLDCTWKFSESPDSCNTVIMFDVSFEFQSVIYTKLAHVFFDEVVKNMVSAFEKRAIHKHQEKQATNN